MGRNGNAILVALLMVAATVYLMSRPQCGRGCRTVLEHLLTHELEALL